MKKSVLLHVSVSYKVLTVWQLALPLSAGTFGNPPPNSF